MMMKACIMCGGEGTRLRPLTFARPKPTIPILNKPSVAHLVEHLSREGFNDIVITLGYLGGEVEAALGDGRMFGVHIEYVREKSKLGTAGSVKNAAEFFGDETFIVVGGDHVMDLDLRAMFRYHEQNENDSLITIGLTPIDNPQEYGIADIDINNVIRRFLEKPRSGEIFSNLASTGIYVCSSEILDYIPPQNYDFAKDLFPELMAKNGHLRGYLVRGHWTDIGNPAAYRQACRWLLEELPGTKIAGRFSIKDARVTGPIDISHNFSLGDNSALVGPIVIGENTAIGDNVLIGPYTTIGSNCIIEDNTRILSSYIFNNVRIQKGTIVSGSIIDNGSVIGRDCVLETGTVIGPDVFCNDGSTIHSGVRIYPKSVVNAGEKVREDRINQV